MRTAIVHDWFQGFHGSERVVEAMRAGLFGADEQPDVYTFHAAHELLPSALDARIVGESRLAALPGIRQRGHDPGRWRYLLPAMPHYFRSLDLGAYDLVLSSSHSCALNARARPGALHVCYCHTPMRYAWTTSIEEDRAGGLKGAALAVAAGWLRRVDREAAQRVDHFVANSTAVAERIMRFYGREATVIHPPVDVDDFDPAAEKDPALFVWVHRLVSYKRPEIVAEAFRGLPYRLVMVGVGPLEERLRAALPPNVELRGWIDRAELAALVSRASGFVHVAEEDFGISMVEALAAGTPVIGLDRGGARDIVRDGLDGVLVHAASVERVREAVERIVAGSWDRRELAERAATFSTARFLERMRTHLDELGANRAGSNRSGRSVE